MREDRAKAILKKYDKFIPAVEGRENFKRRLNIAPDSCVNRVMNVEMKSVVGTIVLAIFLGFAGIDRFFSGDWKMGLIKLGSFFVMILANVLQLAVTGIEWLGGIITIVNVAFAVIIVMDIFFSYRETQRVNYDRLSKVLHNALAEEIKLKRYAA